MSSCKLRYSFLIAFAACGVSKEGAPPAYPSDRGAVCSYVGLEAESRPAHDTLDAVSLVAVYRLDEPNAPPPSAPIELKFLVQRSRVNDLRGQLEAHPEVVCRPDRDAHYRVEASNFGEFAPER